GDHVVVVERHRLCSVLAPRPRQRRQRQLFTNAAITPASRVTATRNGRFHATLNGELLTTSRQPLLDGARELLERGYDPNTRIVMRHDGSKVDALPSTIGAAAKLTVEERAHRRIRFAAWKHHPHFGDPAQPMFAFDLAA